MRDRGEAARHRGRARPARAVRRGVDAIYAADHQVPLADGPHHPREVRARARGRRGAAEEIVGAIIDVDRRRRRSHDGVVIAHFFSILPKVGLDESDVAAGAAGAARARDRGQRRQRIEISERWRCPSARTLRPFVEHGVPILLSTDSHRRETIGRYEHCSGVLESRSRAAEPVIALEVVLVAFVLAGAMPPVVGVLPVRAGELHVLRHPARDDRRRCSRGWRSWCRRGTRRGHRAHARPAGRARVPAPTALRVYVVDDASTDADAGTAWPRRPPSTRALIFHLRREHGGRARPTRSTTG